MNNRYIEYKVGFVPDTAQLKKALQEATNELDKLGMSKINGIDGRLLKSADAAAQLSRNIKMATDQDTGKLNLTKLDQQLKASGKTLNQYGLELIKLGPSGTKAFMDIANSIVQAEVPTKRITGLLQKMGTTFANTVRWNISTSVWNNLVGLTQKAYGYAQDLNESLNSIRIVSGKSAAEMKDFAKYANQAAKSLSTTTTKYSDASLIYFQQGLPEQEVKERTEVTMKMANVAGESAETVADQLTSVWNNFYTGSKSLEYYADVMVKLGAATASSSDEISQGIDKFAAVANTIGLSYEYAASALATITAETRQSADEVGTSLRTTFARIQGLKLGETLDDGTTLNKYSEALYKVGINIKDQKGELKNMDTILSEMGEKWQSLEKDEQVALAQTVAGVRQYTQLVALMDKWDVFQKNLATAYDAEGALSKQNDIYAESWLAARDRVKASLENIYDSIVNDQFFIQLDNIGTPILNGIAYIVDALGGASGLLNTIGAIVLTKYGPQVSQWLSKTYTDIKTIMGLEQESAKNLQATAVEAAMAAANKGASYYSNSQQQLELKMMREKMELQNLINAKIENFSDEQKQSLRLDLQQLDVLKDKAIYYESIIAKEREATQELQDDTYWNMSTLGDEQTNVARERALDYLSGDKFQGTRAYELADKYLSDPKTPDGLPEFIAEMMKSSSAMYNQKAAMQDLNQEMSKMASMGAVTAESIEGFKNKLIETDPSLKESVGNCQNLDEVQTILKNRITELTQELSVMAQAAKAAGAGKPFEEYQKSAENAAKSTVAAKNALQLYQDAYARTGKIIQQYEQAPLSFSEKLVCLSRAAMQTANALRSIQNLGSIWEKDNLDTTEKMVQSITSLAMITPTLISGYRAITKISFLKNILNEPTNIETKTLPDLKNQLAEKQKNTEILKQSFLEKLNQAQTQNKNISYIENTDDEGNILSVALDYGFKKGNKKYRNTSGDEKYGQLNDAAKNYNESLVSMAENNEAVTIAEDNLSKATRKAMLARFAASAAMAAALIVITLIVKAVDNYIHRQERAREAMQKSAEAVQAEKDKLTEINDTLKTTKDRIKELQDKGTLTFVEQSELAKLQTQQTLLEQEAAIQDRILLIKQKQQAIDVEKNSDTANLNTEKISSTKADKFYDDTTKAYSLKEDVRDILTAKTGMPRSAISLWLHGYQSAAGINIDFDKSDKRTKAEWKQQEASDMEKIADVLMTIITNINSGNRTFEINGQEFTYSDSYDVSNTIETERALREKIVELRQDAEESSLTSLFQLEQDYQTYYELYKNDATTNTQFLEEQIEKLKEARLATLENPEDIALYYDLYIKPILNTKALEEVKKKIYAAFRSKKGIDSISLSTQDREILLQSGLSADDFLTSTEEAFQERKNKITERLGVIYSGGLETLIENLSDEDFEIFLEINPEKVNKLEDVGRLIEKIKSTKIDVFNTENIEKAKELLEKIQKNTLTPLQKAFQAYKSNNGFLTTEEAQELIASNEEFAKYLINNGNGTYNLTQQAVEDYKLNNKRATALLDETIKEKNKDNDKYFTVNTLAQQVLDGFGNELDEKSDIGKLLSGIAGGDETSIVDDILNGKKTIKTIVKNNKITDSSQRDETIDKIVNLLYSDFNISSDSINVYKQQILRAIRNPNIWKNLPTPIPLDENSDNFIRANELFKELQNDPYKYSQKEEKTYLADWTKDTKQLAAYTTYYSNSLYELNKQFLDGKIKLSDYYKTQKMGLKTTNDLLLAANKEYIRLNTETNEYVAKNLDKLSEEEKTQVNDIVDQLNKNRDVIDSINDSIVDTTEALEKYYDVFENAYGVDEVTNKLLEPAEKITGELAQQVAEASQEIFKAYGKNNREALKKMLVDIEYFQEEVAGRLSADQFIDALYKGQVSWETWEEILNSSGFSGAVNEMSEEVSSPANQLMKSVGETIKKIGESLKDLDLSIDIKFTGNKTSLMSLIKAIETDIPISLGTINFSNGNSSGISGIGEALTQGGEALITAANNSASVGFSLFNTDKTGDNYNPTTIDEILRQLKNPTEKNYTVQSLEELSALSEPLKDIDNALAGIDTKLKDLDKQNGRTFGPEKIKNYREQIELLNKGLVADQERTRQAKSLVDESFAEFKNKYGEELIIDDESGTVAEIGKKYKVLNDQKVALQEDYNKTVEKYNAIVEAGGTPDDTAFQSYKKSFDMKMSYIENEEKALKKAEDNVKEYTESQLKEIERLYEISDKKLSEMEARFEIIYKKIELRANAREIQKEYLELIRNDENYNNITQRLSDMSLSGANWAYSQYEEAFRQYKEARDALNNADEYTDRAGLEKQIEDSLDKMKSSFSSIKQYIAEFEETYTKAIDTIGERFNRLFDLLSHESTVIDSIQELYELQNVTAKTADGFNKINKALEANYKTSITQAKEHKNNFEAYQEEYLRLGNLMLNYENNSPEYALLLRDQQKVKDLMNEEEEAYLSTAKEAFSTVEEMYSAHIENIFAIYEEKASNGLGFEFLEDSYANIIEEQDRYLDNENSAYEALTLKNKIQNSLLNTQNQYYTNELQSLKKEIEMRKTSGKLTQYDVDLLNAKYNLTLAQMALEDAQNAKNSVRLVRNSAGNWDYQFVADQTAIDNAEQNVADKRNELYNIEKDRLREVEEDRVSILREYSEKMKKVAEDTDLSDEDRKKQVDEINRYYKTKVSDLSKQATIVRNDLKELGIDVYTEWSEQYGQMLTNSDNMLRDFDALSMELTSKCFAAVDEYQENMKKTSEETGTVVDDLNKRIDKSSSVIDSLNAALKNLNDTLKEQFKALGPTIEKLDEYIIKLNQIEEVKDSYSKVSANEILMNQEGATATSGYAKNVDYLQLMIDRWAKNGHVWDSTMETLNQERDAKSLAEGITEVTQGDQTKSAFENGDFNNRTYDKAKAAQRWKDYLSKKGTSSFDTGGYTGEFQDGKLALLHQKELVLNQDDTKNILSAVSAVRALGPEVFSQIEKLLDASARAGITLMGNKLFGSTISSNVSKEKAPIEQNVVIQADFPGVSSAIEIEAALTNLVNDAAQDASIYE